MSGGQVPEQVAIDAMARVIRERNDLRYRLAAIKARVTDVRGGCPNGFDPGESCGCLLCDIRAILHRTDGAS